MTIIGIDLGTSNSAASVLCGGRPVIIPSAEGVSIGGKAFPSYVAVTADGQVLVGEPARRQAAANPEGTASGKSQSISITGSTRLSEDAKKRMVEDAKRYADADKKRPEDAEKLNAAAATCYEAEKMLAQRPSPATPAKARGASRAAAARSRNTS